MPYSTFLSTYCIIILIIAPERFELSKNGWVKASYVRPLRHDALYGPSDRSRSCGLMLPKHALFQLSYTRIKYRYWDSNPDDVTTVES